MKPKQPLPMDPPFLTILTRTYRRPEGLARNFASVARQTAVAQIEHIVLPDHLGVSPADAVYGQLPDYAHAVHGQYVHVLGDDDVLADPTVVAQVKLFAHQHDTPPSIRVAVLKGDTRYPKCGRTGDPAEGDLDLACFVIRADVWRQTFQAYRSRYVCDWDYYLTLCAAGGTSLPCDLLFAIGAVGGGRPEMDY